MACNGWRLVGGVRYRGLFVTYVSMAVGHRRLTSDGLFHRAVYQMGWFRSSVEPFVTKSCLTGYL